ncbi:alpha/beta hydrolase [Desulfobacterales bacterium HSG17]|nr:alpha/beta hydrolase [Desulfobacterales bacterium HSG17]
MVKIKNESDIRGAGNLTIDAINGIIDLVEAMHHTIASLGGILGKPNQNRTTGITGKIYRNIRTVSELIGDSIDLLLKQFSSLLGEKSSSPEREAVLAALNGVLGDHLAARNNPLTIPMQFRRNGAALDMDDQAFSQAVRQSNGKIVLMVHGSCMNDLLWNKKGHDHGAALARDLGYLPVYLHYNTGLHISQNGREFAGLIEMFINQLAGPIELVIIAHSMGGLVSRSACHYGKVAGHSWLSHLQKIVFLGTPHHGAPLERAGNKIDIILEISPYSAPFSRLGKIRSAGLTDLRYGNILDKDWKGRDRFKSSGDLRISAPLPDSLQCYTIAATTSNELSILGDQLVGDGLVTVNSALGIHKNTDLNLLFPKTHQWIARNTNHLDLLNHPEVYETIKKWLKNK